MLSSIILPPSSVIWVNYGNYQPILIYTGINRITGKGYKCLSGTDSLESGYRNINVGIGRTQESSFLRFLIPPKTPTQTLNSSYSLYTYYVYRAS